MGTVTALPINGRVTFVHIGQNKFIAHVQLKTKEDIDKMAARVRDMGVAYSIVPPGISTEEVVEENPLGFFEFLGKKKGETTH